MKTVKKIEDILNILDKTAIVVVREKDYKILYLNEKAKESNMICSDVWKKHFENHAIKAIKEKVYMSSGICDEKWKSTMSVCDVKILWQENIPSFVITVSASNTEEKKESDFNTKEILKTVSWDYEVIMVADFKEDKCIFIQNRQEMFFSEKEKLSLFLKDIEDKLQENQKEIWKNAFSLANQKEAFSENIKNLTINLYFEKENRWFCCQWFPLENFCTQEMIRVLLVKEITEQKNIEKKQQIGNTFMSFAMQGASAKYIVGEQDVYFLEGSEEYFKIFLLDKKQYNHWGRKIMPWLQEKERKACIDIILEKSGKKEPFVVEMCKKEENGEINWFQIQGMFIGQEDTYLVYYVVLIDISDKKRLEMEQKAMFDCLSGSIVKIKLDDRLTILETNEHFFTMFGEKTNAGFLDRIYGIDKKVIQKEFAKLIQVSAHFKMELRILNAKDEVMWIHMEGNEISRENNIPIYLFVMMDITNYIQMRMQLEEVQEKYQKNIVSTNQKILEYDNNKAHFVVSEEEKSEDYYKNISFQYYIKQGNIVFSEAIKNQIGMKMCYDNFIEDLKRGKVVFEQDWNVLKNIYRQCQLDSISVKAQIRLLTINDSYEWFELCCTPLWDHKKRECIKIIGTLININALRQMQNEATVWREKARKDPLTKLYNRMIFREKVINLLKECKTGALAFIDVDNFKKVNDTLGHAIGDDVLVTVAKRLCHSFREKEDVIGRYGGDEFVVFIKNMPSYEALQRKLEQLIDVLHEKYEKGSVSWKITGSIGAVMYPKDGKEYDILLERADAALYASKKRGRDCFTIYTNYKEID